MIGIILVATLRKENRQNLSIHVAKSVLLAWSAYNSRTQTARANSLPPQEWGHIDEVCAQGGCWREPRSSLIKWKLVQEEKCGSRAMQRWKVSSRQPLNCQLRQSVKYHDEASMLSSEHQQDFNLAIPERVVSAKETRGEAQIASWLTRFSLDAKERHHFLILRLNRLLPHNVAR